MSAPHLLAGRRGERAACRYLLSLRFDIIARRFRGRRGEIDIIALEGETLAFIEVKTRRSTIYGEPWQFVDWRKQQRLRRAADEFVSRHDLSRYAYRFDIVSVVAPASPGEEIVLYRNAF